MPNKSHVSLAAFAAAAFTAGALAVLAMPSAGAAERDPIHVSSCDPRSGFTNRAYPAGYVRGYYPGSPFYWRDPYGFRYYQPPLYGPAPSAPTLGISYTNASSKTATAIDFGLVARGHLVAEVRDVGTFTPGAPIKHEFGLSPNVFPLGTGLARCPALLVQFSDGTVWRNPHHPHAAASLYRRQAGENASPRP